MLPIGQCQRLLELAKFHWAQNDPSKAKSEAMKAISSLNEALKMGEEQLQQEQQASINDLKTLCREAISMYQELKSGKKLSFDESLRWLCSSLNGTLRPPIALTVSTFINTTAPLDDDSNNNQLPLSAHQKLLLDSWNPIPLDQDWTTNGVSEVYQDLLQDCSFVTSLISLARNNTDSLLHSITPHDSSSLRFGIQLHFNGSLRLVEVGNALPFLTGGNSLFIKSKTNDSLYWPALLEKAYLTIMGQGYDSHGSNASIDTFILSGWIPQFITVSERPNMDQLWDSIYAQFQDNQVVLSLGTGSHINGINVDQAQLSPNHDYCISELIQESKSVVIKNPWMSQITVLEFSELFDHFETLYINWNPSNFKTHRSIHCIYNNPDNRLYYAPQLHIRNDGPHSSEVKLLLERHLGSSPSNINLKIYKSNDGHRLFTKTIPMVTSSTGGNNTGFHLSNITLNPGESCIAVIYNDSSITQNFTLHAYTNTELTLQRAQRHQYPELKTLQGEWTVESCGGNWSYQSYIKNPQYELDVPLSQDPGNDDDGELDMVIALFTKGDTLINAQLFFHDDKKPFSQRPSIINEKYQPGQLITRAQLKPGQRYKLVLSTYDPDIHTSFKLVINSTRKVQLTKLNPRLGLFLKPFTFSWNNKNRFRLNFTVTRETLIKIHLWSSSNDSSTVNSFATYRPKIRASLFYKQGTPIQINEEFDDCLYGIWLTPVMVRPGQEIILLVERFELGQDEVFGEIGSDQKIEWVR